MILYIVCKVGSSSVTDVLLSMRSGELRWYNSPEVAKEEALQLTHETGVKYAAYAFEVSGEFVERIY